MHFGFYLPTEGDFADAGSLAQLAREAEDAGWDGLFIWDALLPVYEHSDEIREALGDTGDIVDPYVALTAIAACTERLRFGALVTPLPRLRPEAATGPVRRRRDRQRLGDAAHHRLPPRLRRRRCDLGARPGPQRR